MWRIITLHDVAAGSPIDAYVPEKLSHFRRRGNQLFFLLSERPSCVFDDLDAELHGRIDGSKTVGELSCGNAGVLERLMKWRDLGIVALVAPCSRPTRPHLVVIEPHMDDAALSVGGRLLRRRGQWRVTILAVTRRSNFTSYLAVRRPFLDRMSVDDISRLRLEESLLAARLLGAEFRCLDWDDAPLRFWPTSEWSPETVDHFNVDAFTTYAPRSHDVQKLERELKEQLIRLSPDEVWIPMGLGGHVDHRLTRSACARALADAQRDLGDVRVEMYEDVPYATNHEVEHIRSALARAGVRLIPSTEPIADVFEGKLQTLSVFASQFKMSAMEPRVRTAAGEPCVERYHVIEGALRAPNESDLSLDPSGVGAGLVHRTRELLQNRVRTRRLVVMALGSGHLGMWRADRDRILSAFPHAILHLYLSTEVSWQLRGDSRADRLVITRVAKGRWRWMLALVREALRFGSPTIMVARGAHSARNSRLRVLVRVALPFRTLLFATKLNEFCAVLEDEVESTSADQPAQSAAPGDMSRQRVS